MENYLDFRLNKAQIQALIELFLDKCSTIASIEQEKNINYEINPRKGLDIRYGKHQNAQEIANNYIGDSCGIKVDKYINGYYLESILAIFRFDSFTLDLNNCELKQILNSDDSFITDYYQFMYLIFGQTYQTALLDYLNTRLSDNLRREHQFYLANLQAAVKKGKKNNVLGEIRRKHKKQKQFIQKIYENNLYTAQHLGELSVPFSYSNI